MQKRTVFFLFFIIFTNLIYVNCSPKVNKEKFKDMYRATKAIQGATMAGVNYIKFGELLQNFATELLIIKDNIETDKERLIFYKYDNIYNTYKDSYEFWRVNNSESGGMIIFPNPYILPLKFSGGSFLYYKKEDDHVYNSYCLYFADSIYKYELDKTNCLSEDRKALFLNCAINKIWDEASRQIKKLQEKN